MMLCIAHRGARAERPENTIAAIELAIKQGADAIEIDVREHQGQLIIFHDEIVDRTTSSRGELSNFSFEQLRQLDAGNGQKIPILGEVILSIAQRVPLNIELKDNASAPLVLACIEDFVSKGWEYKDFIVSSFFHPLLQSLKQQQPQLAIGALSAGVMVDYAAFAQNLDAVSINLCSDSINQAIIDDAHQRGLKVFIYTVNDIREFEQFYQMGADGLFTDYPLKLKRWIELKSKQ